MLMNNYGYCPGAFYDHMRALAQIRVVAIKRV